MENENLKMQVLFELALQQLKGNTPEEMIHEILPLYMRKLSCFMAAIIDDNENKIIPGAMRNGDLWKVLQKSVSTFAGKMKNGVVEFVIDDGFFYAYSLGKTRWFIVGRKRLLDADIKYELVKLINQLGKLLKQAEEEEKLKLFQNIINNSSDPVQVTTENGQIFYLNHIASKQMGLDPHKEVHFFIQDDHADSRDQQKWKKYIEDLKNVDFRVIEGHQINHSTGLQFPVELTVKYVNIDGKGFVIANSRDITERKKAEEELSYHSRMQDILINISASYINMHIDEVNDVINRSLNELGTFVNADRAYVFEYDWEKGICNNTYEWCQAGITPQIEELQEVPLDFIPDWVNTHKQGKTMLIEDVFSLPKDDGVRAILEPQEVKSLITIPMMSGDICLGFVGFDSVNTHHRYSEREQSLLLVFAQMLVNIDNRVKAYHELQHYSTELESKNIQLDEALKHAQAANKAKSEFLANMSHEIRTPMNSILGFSEVMLNTTNDDKQKNYLKTILDSGKTLMSLINDILDLSKIEAGRMEISAEPTNISVLMQEMKQIFHQKTEEKNITFTLKIDPSFPLTVIIDEIRLRQIMLNLIGNAIKFTEKGGVTVEVAPISDKNGIIDFHISIADTGIGIPERDQQRIFESFTQLSSQDTKKYGGTGLGLTITKRLVELMKGIITVESELGKGTRFSVLFDNIKYSDEQMEESNQYLWDEEGIVFAPSTVLLVDDVPHNRQLISSFLEDGSFDVVEAENGEMAVETAKALTPDLIFMDIRMPGMNGYEATEIIKNTPSTSHIPVVALTASTMQSETEKIMQLFDGYLRKPVQKKSIIYEMTKFLSYTEKPEPDKEKTDIPQVVSDNPGTIPEEVKELFKSTFLNDIEENSSMMILDSLEDLQERIKEFAQTHHIPALGEKADTLDRQISEFDFDNIQELLIDIVKLFRD